METVKQHQVINQLNLIASRIKAQSGDYSDLDVKVLPPQQPGSPYAIDVSKGRISRRISVDMKTAEQLQKGIVDAMLTRELRSVMLSVARLAHKKQ